MPRSTAWCSRRIGGWWYRNCERHSARQKAEVTEGMLGSARGSWYVPHPATTLNTTNIFSQFMNNNPILNRAYDCGGIFNLVGGIPTPLKNIWVRQLGWWHSQYMKSHTGHGHVPLWKVIKAMFQTTNQRWLWISWFLLKKNIYWQLVKPKAIYWDI